MKSIIKSFFRKLGIEINRIPESYVGDIPDAEFYKPVFSPWLGYGDFKDLYEKIRKHTIISAERCFILYSLALQALHLKGDFVECGVYKGGSAKLLAEVLTPKSNPTKLLHLFDAFQADYDTESEKDLLKRDFFPKIELQKVKELMGKRNDIVFHPGIIPHTFSGLEKIRISLAHIDVVFFQAVLDCCEFIIPRLVRGGLVIFDDYGSPLCPGARKAVDQYFRIRPEEPLVLSTGQALIFKSSI